MGAPVRARAHPGAHRFGGGSERHSAGAAAGHGGEVIATGNGAGAGRRSPGVERHAIWRWKKDPRFQAEVRRLAGELSPRDNLTLERSSYLGPLARKDIRR